MDVRGIVRRFNEEQQAEQSVPGLSPEELSRYQAGLLEVRQVFNRFAQSRRVTCNVRISENVYRSTYIPVNMGRHEIQVGNQTERLPISAAPELEKVGDASSDPANKYRLRVFVPDTEPGGSLYEQYGELDLGCLEIDTDVEATPGALRHLEDFSELLDEVFAEATVEGIWSAVALASIMQPPR